MIIKRREKRGIENKETRGGNLWYSLQSREHIHARRSSPQSN